MSRRKTSRSLPSLLPPCLALAGFLVACSEAPPGEEPLETVDVEPALELETVDDQQAPERKAELAGRLPSDFPADLPLFLPASLVDFGESPNGATVTLLTPRPLAEVRRQLLEQARALGWSVAPGSAGQYELSRAGRRVRLEVGDGHPGASYAYVY